MTEILKRDFYLRNGLEVARDLLGKIIVREEDGERFYFKIVETEAYLGPEDKAAHTYGGKPTPRTRPIFEEGGITYIYLIYGMYYCLNIVAHEANIPHCVLIRAVEPLNDEAIAYSKLSRNIKSKKTQDLTNGPGKLCKALKIDKTFNELDITKQGALYIVGGDTPREIVTDKRINIDYAKEYKEKEWRFYIQGNAYVSVLKK